MNTLDAAIAKLPNAIYALALRQGSYQIKPGHGRCRATAGSDGDAIAEFPCASNDDGTHRFQPASGEGRSYLSGIERHSRRAEAECGWGAGSVSGQIGIGNILPMAGG